LSSGAIYGSAALESNSQITEGTSSGPDLSSVASVYAEGKRAAEMLATVAASHGLPVRVARCFAFVGPHMPFNGHFAIGNFIADTVHGRKIRVLGNGKPVRSYLYTTDLMQALILILCRGVSGKAYNVGSDQAISIEDLAHRVNEVLGGNGVVIEGRDVGACSYYVPDISRLRDGLGFSPQISLDSAIQRTGAWYRAQLERNRGNA
jgi:nucleoside-diphosphate-sugar epimerase